MARHPACYKPLPKPMMTQFTDVYIGNQASVS